MFTVVIPVRDYLVSIRYKDYEIPIYLKVK